MNRTLWKFLPLVAGAVVVLFARWTEPASRNRAVGRSVREVVPDPPVPLPSFVPSQSHRGPEPQPPAVTDPAFVEQPGGDDEVRLATSTEGVRIEILCPSRSIGEVP